MSDCTEHAPALIDVRLCKQVVALRETGLDACKMYWAPLSRELLFSTNVETMAMEWSEKSCHEKSPYLKSEGPALSFSGRYILPCASTIRTRAIFAGAPRESCMTPKVS